MTQAAAAVIAAQNANRAYSPYFAGFPNPRKSPYTFHIN